MGSDRGMYLEDLNESLKDLKDDLEGQERDKPVWLRRHDPLKVHETYKRFDQKWADRCANAARPCNWLNEWWGPEVQNPLRLSPRNGQHPSAQGCLTPQYMGGKEHKKRKSDPGFIFPATGKRSKKEHKRFLEPQAERADRRNSEPLCPSHLSDLPLWRPAIPPPSLAPMPKTKFCSFCGGKDQSDGSPLFLCARCNLVAYCSKGCQSTHALPHKSICRPAAVQPLSPNTSIDMGNYILEGQEDVLAAVLAKSAAEAGLQPDKVHDGQWQAKVSSCPPKDFLPVNDCDIVGFRVDVPNRLLEYRVRYGKPRKDTWRRGVSLQGDLWTGRIRRFWDTNASRRDRLWRFHLEHGHDGEYYPVQMGRYILAFKILEERNFQFFVQLNDEETFWSVFLGPE
ncbi:hypothetical protein LTR86_010127 [Recurvomyces mirabilis]|nr:hypothetical protein LTR86_010127 [Recurvomyces mirabilis]